MILITAAFLVSSFLQIAESENCQSYRELQRAVSDTEALGYYEVQCDETDANKYVQRQCWPSTGRCWCVDKYGNTIPDSHVNPGQTLIDCEKFGWCHSAVLKLMKGYAQNNETTPPIGAFTPECDDYGNFAKTQSWGSTGQSWCAVENGNRVPGTVTGPTEKSWDCENLPACLAKEASLAHLLVDGIYPFGLDRPECDGEGNYRQEQCHGSTGYCWCVEKESGTELDDTRRGPGADGGYIDCAESKDKFMFDAATATSCQKLFNVQRDYLDKLEHPMLGFWSVSCLDDGSFAPSQCHPSTGHCWCVDEHGHEVSGSRSLPGAPRMPCDSKPPTCSIRKAMLDKEMESFTLIGMFSPECEEGDGSYKSKQCWGSTGQCWCVTKDAGKEIAYTRRGPTEKPDLLDCSGVARPPASSRLSNVRDDPEDDDDDDDDEGESAGSSTSLILIVVIAVLACVLVAVVVGGVVFFKRRNSNGPQYTEVNAEL